MKDKTHSEHAHFFETASSLTKEQQAATSDFYIFKPEEVPHWESFKTLPLAAKAGSVFLWDSRTVHAVRSLLLKAYSSLAIICHLQAAMLHVSSCFSLGATVWQRLQVITSAAAGSCRCETGAFVIQG